MHGYRNQLGEFYEGRLLAFIYFVFSTKSESCPSADSEGGGQIFRGLKTEGKKGIEDFINHKDPGVNEHSRHTDI